LVVALEFREGQAVRKDRPVARLRTDWHELRLRAAEGRLQEAGARLELAESQLARARRLVADEIISQEDLDDASSEFSAWEGRRAQSLAEIAQLELTLERCIIRAPFDGVIVRKRTEVGQWIDVGSPVAEIVALDQLEVRVEVPENYFFEIANGAEAIVTFESLPGDELIGRVEGIIPRADPQARTFPIKVAISNPERRIGVGMLAEVALPLGDPYRAVVVPKDALVRQGNAEIVFRIAKDGTVEPVPVVRGTGIGSWVAVEGPIAPGEQIVTRGNERLRPGQEVEGDLQEYPLP
jgi:RND family efflux transporter MFP subunit